MFLGVVSGFVPDSCGSFFVGFVSSSCPHAHIPNFVSPVREGGYGNLTGDLRRLQRTGLSLRPIVHRTLSSNSSLQTRFPRVVALLFLLLLYSSVFAERSTEFSPLGVVLLRFAGCCVVSPLFCCCSALRCEWVDSVVRKRLFCFWKVLYGSVVIGFFGQDCLTTILSTPALKPIGVIVSVG